MFSSRDDYERVIKLLLAALHSSASAYDTTPLLTYDEDADGNPRVTFTDRQLTRSDRYRLDVTQRPDGRHAPAELELRLLPDDGWAPGYLDEEDP